MLDVGVDMIRSACEDDRHFSFFPALREDLLCPRFKPVEVFVLRFDSRFHRFFYRAGRNSESFEVCLARFFKQSAVVEGDDGRIDVDPVFFISLDRVYENVGISCDYRAVVAVGRSLVLFAFVDDVRIEDPVDLFRNEVHDMSVHQFRREADVVGHDRFDAAFVKSARRSARKDREYAAFVEKGVPERIILVNSESARDAEPHFSVFWRDILAV